MAGPVLELTLSIMFCIALACCYDLSIIFVLRWRVYFCKPKVIYIERSFYGQQFFIGNEWIVCLNSLLLLKLAYGGAIYSWNNVAGTGNITLSIVPYAGQRLPMSHFKQLIVNDNDEKGE